MVYQHFIKEIKKRNIKIDLSDSVLIHGGGWKKLVNESITSEEFRKMLNQLCGITSVHDYYGMVEQTGSIFMECEYSSQWDKWIPLRINEKSTKSDSIEKVYKITNKLKRT